MQDDPARSLACPESDKKDYNIKEELSANLNLLRTDLAYSWPTKIIGDCQLVQFHQLCQHYQQNGGSIEQHYQGMLFWLEQHYTLPTPCIILWPTIPMACCFSWTTLPTICCVVWSNTTNTMDHSNGSSSTTYTMVHGTVSKHPTICKKS